MAAQIATLVATAALFFGEARYRVPYDPLLLCLAVAGLWTIGGRARARREPHGLHRSSGRSRRRS